MCIRDRTNSIFTDDDDETLVEVWPLSNPKNFYILINGKNIDMPSIQEGKLENNDNFYYVSVCDIIEKCCLLYTSRCV